jgi:hypothetical protein
MTAEQFPEFLPALKVTQLPNAIIILLGTFLITAE